MRLMKFVLCLIFAFSGLLCKAQTPLPNAHAHNDYEHERPLLDALDHGFTSVEADVWLIDGELYVYHDKPANPDPDRTLEKLYLTPLLERVKEHDGVVYEGYKGLFYLMIDFKTEAVTTYRVLKPLLSKYESILANPSTTEIMPLKVFISGSRPVEQILNDPTSLAALDGRPGDLGKGISHEEMPVVSESYGKFSRWRGEGEMPLADQKKIKALVEAAHAEGKKVRLWANPDNTAGWEKLMELGVDLINTDKLRELSEFMRR